MPRLRQIPREEAHDTAKTLYQLLFGDRDPIAEPGTETGTPGNWWTVFAGGPDTWATAAGLDLHPTPTATATSS